MNEANASFARRSDFAPSLLCAALLTAAMFSILPFSTGGNFASELSLGKPVKVWSLEKSFSSETSSPNSARGLSLDVPSISPELPIPDSSEILSILESNIFPRGIQMADISESPEKSFVMREFAVSPDSRNFSSAVFELSSLDKIPRMLRHAAVKYPQNLFEAGREGEVRLSVVIESDGTLTVEGVEDGSDADFIESARSAVEKMLFEVPTKGGMPVRARFILPIPFKIQNGR